MYKLPFFNQYGYTYTCTNLQKNYFYLKQRNRTDCFQQNTHHHVETFTIVFHLPTTSRQSRSAAFCTLFLKQKLIKLD